jgi:hypothetical protein
VCVQAEVEEWRQICLSQSLQWLMDVPFVLMALITSLALWGRSFYFWGQLCDVLLSRDTPTTATTTRAKRQNCAAGEESNLIPASSKKSWRQLTWEQFLCAVLDVPAFLCLVVVFLTQWNARPLLAKLKV